jgi:hypothetical protein
MEESMYICTVYCYNDYTFLQQFLLVFARDRAAEVFESGFVLQHGRGKYVVMLILLSHEIFETEMIAEWVYHTDELKSNCWQLKTWPYISVIM